MRATGIAENLVHRIISPLSVCKGSDVAHRYTYPINSQTKVETIELKSIEASLEGYHKDSSKGPKSR